eukprot:PhM_4_TR13925/c0_g1_i1/m.100653
MGCKATKERSRLEPGRQSAVVGSDDDSDGSVDQREDVASTTVNAVDTDATSTDEHSSFSRLRASLQQQQQQQLTLDVNDTRLTPCRLYWQVGYCPLGPRCRYMHNLVITPGTAVSAATRRVNTNVVEVQDEDGDDDEEGATQQNEVTNTPENSPGPEASTLEGVGNDSVLSSMDDNTNNNSNNNSLTIAIRNFNNNTNNNNGTRSATRVIPRLHLRQLIPLGYVIRTLPTYTFDSAAVRVPDPERDKCVMCLEQYEDGAEIMTVPCMHRFHKDCVTQWLIRDGTCPLCRHPIM